MSSPKPPSRDFIDGVIYAAEQARQAHHIGLKGEQIADHILRSASSLEEYL